MLTCSATSRSTKDSKRVLEVFAAAVLMTLELLGDRHLLVRGQGRARRGQGMILWSAELLLRTRRAGIGDSKCLAMSPLPTKSKWMLLTNKSIQLILQTSTRSRQASPTTLRVRGGSRILRMRWVWGPCLGKATLRISYAKWDWLQSIDRSQLSIRSEK